MSISAFLIDYGHRHAHPVNAVLHIAGVPMVLYAVCLMFRGSFVLGLALFVLGYVLQYFGHLAQGNEVGEITLIKRILRKYSTPGCLFRILNAFRKFGGVGK